MSLFSSTALCGVLSQRTQINETLNSETFASVVSSWTWKTPGTIQAASAWSAGNGNTPTVFGGPAGGGAPSTGAIEAANQYAYTEASGAAGTGPFTLESPVFDAGAGTLTLTFQAHLAFYSNGTTEPLVSTDGTLTVQGWNGSAWVNVGSAITGTKQVSALTDATAAAAEAAAMAYLPSSAFGTYTSSGFSNPDFQFRFRFVKGISVDVAHYDCAIDNVKILGPAGAVIVQPPPPADSRTAALATGLGTIFVSPTGNDGNNGQTLATAKRTIQAGVNALQTGFVLRIQDGVYREVVTCSNKSGVWIAAENPGKVRISNYWKEAEEGTVVWTNLGNGVFRSTKPTGNRAWAGHDGTDFLFPYLNEADLRATTITAQDNQVGGPTTVTKPTYGMATNSGGNQIFVRLRGNANPQGKPIFITNDFKKTLMFMNNCDNSIVDGISYEGAGDTQALEWDLNCANPTVRNCTFDLCRHGVRYRSNMILEWDNYKYTGFAKFSQDVYSLDGRAANGTFVLCKGYYNAATTGNISGGGAGNAVLEGSHAMQSGAGNIPVNVVEEFCLIDECFDGCRIGDCNNSVVRFCVFLENRDDCIQVESSAGHPASGIEIHDCYMKDSFRYISHQEDSINGDSFVHHNIFDMSTLLSTPTSSQFLKMISSPPECDAFYYNNVFLIDLGQNSGGSFQIWSDFGGATADEIENFYNNAVIIPRELTNGGGPNPKSIQNNVVVGPSSGTASFLTVNGGVFAGTARADMELNADFSPISGSPVIGPGRALISGHPNSVRLDTGASRSSSTVGVFNLGEVPGAAWPRPHELTFDLTVPSRWTSPGA